ncbi:MAG: thioredoxin family protein [Syntrophobacteraceae bacterium]
MADKDITRISVGEFSVGILGLKQVMNKMAGTHADKSDEEVCSFMLAELARDNYIPRKAKENYGRAFLREFRRFLGQPFTDDAPKGLDIKVLGVGCAQCHALTQMVMEVLTDLNLPAGVDHITDIKEIAGYGVAGAPALLINSRVMVVGSVPPRDKVKKWLTEASVSFT